jgi:uncharacterized protein
VRLIPRDEKFFDLFNELALRLTRCARLLNELFTEPNRLDELGAAIKAIEHEADQLTYQVIARIDTSFVTPLDREDIYMLASRLDDVIDLLDGTARRVTMFRITEVREPAKRLSNVLTRAAEAIENAVREMKKPKVVAQHSRAIKVLEEEGDAIYAEAVAGLFDGTPNPIEVIKWKELYDTLEGAIDQCEDVANVLESISIKNS